MNTTRPQLLIAVPKLFCFRATFEQTVQSALRVLGEVDTFLVSDKAGKARSLLEENGISIQEVNISSRIDAKTAAKKFSHILVFWDSEELTDLIYFAKLFNKHLRIVPVQITKVRNRDAGEPFDVYIGRKTPWGNPYPIEHNETGAKRDDVIKKFKEYFQKEFLNNPENFKHLLALRGLRLGCHCKPLACHGDIIADFLNEYFDTLEQSEPAKSSWELKVPESI